MQLALELGREFRIGWGAAIDWIEYALANRRLVNRREKIAGPAFHWFSGNDEYSTIIRFCPFCGVDLFTIQAPP